MRSHENYFPSFPLKRLKAKKIKGSEDNFCGLKLQEFERMTFETLQLISINNPLRPPSFRHPMGREPRGTQPIFRSFNVGKG